MDINADTLDALYQNLNASFEKGVTETRTIADPLYDISQDLESGLSINLVLFVTYNLTVI